MSTVHVFCPLCNIGSPRERHELASVLVICTVCWPAAHPGGNRFRSRAPTEARGAEWARTSADSLDIGGRAA